jgi:hypothetical protein
LSWTTNEKTPTSVDEVGAGEDTGAVVEAKYRQHLLQCQLPIVVPVRDRYPLPSQGVCTIIEKQDVPILDERMTSVIHGWGTVFPTYQDRRLECRHLHIAVERPARAPIIIDVHGMRHLTARAFKEEFILIPP